MWGLVIPGLGLGFLKPLPKAPDPKLGNRLVLKPFCWKLWNKEGVYNGCYMHGNSVVVIVAASVWRFQNLADSVVFLYINGDTPAD